MCGMRMFSGKTLIIGTIGLIPLIPYFLYKYIESLCSQSLDDKNKKVLIKANELDLFANSIRDSREAELQKAMTEECKTPPPKP